MRIEPARVADGLAFMREKVLPQLRIGAGYHSGEVLIDRSSGNGAFVTTWADEDNATLADTVLDKVTRRWSGSGQFPRTEAYTMVRAFHTARLTFGSAKPL